MYIQYPVPFDPVLGIFSVIFRLLRSKDEETASSKSSTYSFLQEVTNSPRHALCCFTNRSLGPHWKLWRYSLRLNSATVVHSNSKPLSAPSLVQTTPSSSYQRSSTSSILFQTNV